jgi:hypothetical protein
MPCSRLRGPTGGLVGGILLGQIAAVASLRKPADVTRVAIHDGDGAGGWWGEDCSQGTEEGATAGVCSGC